MVIVGVLTVAVFPHCLTVVLLSSKLGVDVRVYELVHVNDIVRPVRARSRSRATACWAKLEVNKTLLVKTIEVLSIIIVLVVVTEVAAVVLVRRGALLEPDGVARDPTEVVVVVIVVFEQTSGGEDAVAKRRRGGNVVGRNFDGFAGGGNACSGQ